MTTLLREWIGRLAATLRPARSDADLEAEVRLHVDLALEDVPPGPARRAVLARLGGAAQALDALRDRRGLPWLEDLAHDVRDAVRGVRRSAVLSAIVILSLALGIGANTALLSLVEAAFLRDLPVDAPGDLVYLEWRSSEWMPDMDRFAGSASWRPGRRRSPTFSNAGFDALRAATAPLTEVFAFSRTMEVNARIDRQADAASMQFVSGSYFAGLRVAPAAGRLLAPADDRIAAPPAVVIGGRLWERRFGRSPAAVGTAVALDGQVFTIAGVAPDAFRGAVAGGGYPDFWIPLAFAPRFGSQYAEPEFWWLTVMGRRAPGAAIEQIRGSLEGPFRAAVRAADAPPAADVPAIDVLPARRGAIDAGPQEEQEIALLAGAIFGVLLFAVCLNVATLLLARAAGRRAEIDLRLALGASRGRLVRRALTESVLLAAAGGTVGLALASWGKGLFAASTLVGPDVDLRLHGGIFAAAMLLSALCGLLVGVVPALRSTRALEGRGLDAIAARGSAPSRLARSLLVAQVAISVVLLVGAGLFVRTLGRWQSIDAGFEVERLLVFGVNPEPLGDEAARAAVRDRIVARIRTIPGVAAVSASGPFWDGRPFGRVRIEGEADAVPFTRPNADRGVHWLPVSHDFFDTVGLPVLAGRAFRPDEHDGPPSVAVIEETIARRLFGGGSPLGRRLMLGSARMTIVGVAANMWLPGTRPDDIWPTIYVPAGTRASHVFPDAEPRRAALRIADLTSIEIRTAAEPLALLPAVRAALGEIDPDLPMIDPKTAAQGMRERLRPTRIVSAIWLSFGAVTLALTAMGLYGLLAGSVTRRTREIGIRTALGARRPEIVALVAGQALRLVLLGITVGLAASMAIHQLSRAYIFGVTVYDPPTLLAVAVLLLAVASLAALLPARRALSLDVAAAVRRE